MSRPFYKNRLSCRNRAGRLAWNLVYIPLFRLSPVPLFAWRNFLLRLLGARLHPTARVYPSVKIWAPWNLAMGPDSCLAPSVDCYNVAEIRVGAHATVSQYSYLCSATHDYRDPGHGLLHGPIEIGESAWLAADVFVGPKVRIGEGAVVGARASVFRDIPPWTVAVGNPARPVKKRAMRRP